MSESADPRLSGGRRFTVHGHEVVVHTTRLPSERHLCFVFVQDPYDQRHDLKIFKGRGQTAEEAEESTLLEALAYLDRHSGSSVSSILAGRHTLDVAGRRVDVFCDTVGEGIFQAFPFLYRSDGSRVLILRFHLNESIVGATPAEAMGRCIRRLEEYFLRGEDEERSDA